MVTKRLRLLVPAAVMVLAGASTAFGQQGRPERPYRGLFGGGGSSGGTGQELTGSLSLGGGYSNGLLLGTRLSDEEDAPERRDARGFNHFSGGLDYGLSLDRGSIRAGVSAAGRYFADLPDPWIAGYGSSIAGSYQLTSRTGFNISQGVAYQPLTNLEFFPEVFQPIPGLAVVDDQSLGDVRDPRLSFTTNAGLSHEISRRTRASAGYSRVQSNTDSVDASSGDTSSGDFTYESFGAQFTHSLSRSLSLRLGYSLGTGHYPGEADGSRFRSHTFDGGIDFNKALSFSRRTHLAFSTGTSAISNGETTRYYVSGNANLTREIGRTWSAGLTYNRSVQFVRTLRQPVFQDAIAATYGGLANRRVQVRLTAGAALGQVGLDPTADSGYTSTFASANLGVGLSRNVGVSVGYTYYRYLFDNAADLPAGSLRQLNRHAVQAGLQVWAPFFQRQRSRSSDASR